MHFDALLPVLTVSASLLLVATSLLNFSVFRRQLSAARQQLENTRSQLEHARQLSEIQLVQRAMSETSDHLRILVDRPYLRPYFYDNQGWAEGDRATHDEVKAMAELLLDNFASAIIHSASFPQYPIRGVEQSIRFHLRSSPALREFLVEAFDRFPLAGLALLSLKNPAREQTIADLRQLIEAAADPTEHARRERLLAHYEAASNASALELAKYSLERKRLRSCAPVAA